MDLSKTLEIRRLAPPYSWVGHIPFATWLIQVFRPFVVVELGVHTGNSFFAMCQSAAEVDLPCKLHGIDTWLGERHAGAYDESVWLDVSGYASKHYPDRVVLHRCLFDEALPSFAANSVDLLHIDGLHTYEAVRHDFETWLPKLSDRAIVLFHDTRVYRDDFGVHRFWAEICERYDGFEFEHSNGLGVLSVGPGSNDFVRSLSAASGQSLGPTLKDYFSSVGNALLERSDQTYGQLLEKGVQFTAYVGLGRPPTFSESQARKTFLPFDERVQLDWPLASIFPGLDSRDINALRLDPANRSCNVEIHDVSLLSEDGVVMHSWHSPEEIDSIVQISVPSGFLPKGAPLLLRCQGDDPQFQLRIPETLLPLPRDARLFVDLKPLIANSLEAQAELLTGLKDILNRLREAESNERSQRLKELESENRLLRERASLDLSILSRQESLIQESSQAFQVISKEREALHEEVRVARGEVVALRSDLINSMDQRQQLIQSTSWQVTAPFRILRRILSRDGLRWFRFYGARMSRRTWMFLPVPLHTKTRIKNAAFRSFPFLFQSTQAYRNWQRFKDIPATSVLAKLPEAMDEDLDAGGYVPLLAGSPPSKLLAKLVCFYLPQFHAIAENDRWWGTGFTEWTNVQPARMHFEGHAQPHIPAELGFYDLLNPSVQCRQIELAKLYGVSAFCFYFYWFGGKRLLETPIENYLKDGSLELDYCLCWANENWSRRWDGLDSEMLIEQQHSPQDDLAFIAHVSKYLRDPRYLRVGSKPVLLVYRPHLLPDPRATGERWRNWCRDNGVGEIYLAYTQSFEAVDPAQYGFDAAIEFPPNNSAPPDLRNQIQPLEKDYQGKVFDWRILVERSENYVDPGYPLFRSVCPEWDNTARRKDRATAFLRSSPALYQQWLSNAIRETVRTRKTPEERLVFVNAWNEWAEGAHLEPDQKRGYAFLQATRNALTGEKVPLRAEKRIVIVSHDAYPHGAQMLVLHMAQQLRQSFGFSVELVCLGDGPLKSDYARWATLHDLTGKDPRGKEAVSLVKQLFEAGHRHALVNTTVAGHFLATLSEHGFACVALVHELSGVIENNRLQTHASSIGRWAQKVVFPAPEVAKSFSTYATLSAQQVVIRPQGLYKRRTTPVDRVAARRALATHLGLGDRAQVVLGVGYADHRKGIDLFVRAGLQLARKMPEVRWVWIGHWESTMEQEVKRLLASEPVLKDRFVFPGIQKDTELFYSGSDVLAMTSREDPFPSVVLEAFDVGVPAVGFEGAGGFTSLIADGAGSLVAMEDVHAFAEAVGSLLTSETAWKQASTAASSIMGARFSFRHYLFDLLDMLGIGPRRVSVVVPNFNYERYLVQRLSSIVEQTHPVYEVIFLDDCSKDGSVEKAQSILMKSGVDYRIVANDVNSGSVFQQWRKGVNLALADFVWIAEADDQCDVNLLASNLRFFETPGVVLTYSESQQIDAAGRKLADNYRAYVDDVDSLRWRSDFVFDGDRAASELLSIKNTIPNVSAAVFRREALMSVMNVHIDEIVSFRVAGDWWIYLQLLKLGRLAFNSRSCNMHRRHASGVTIGNINQGQLDEISRVQDYAFEAFDLSAEIRARQKDYLNRLRREHQIK